MGPEDEAPLDLVEGTAADIANTLSTNRIATWSFRGLVRQRPFNVAFALRRLAKLGRWPEQYWKPVLWHVRDLNGEHRSIRCLQRYIARVLADAPPDFFSNVESAAALFVGALAEQYDVDREASLKSLWDKVWDNASDMEASEDGPVERALHNATGRLGEAALARLWKYQPKPGGAIPATVRPYFDKIAEDPRGHYGRVMLAVRLWDLFGIDPGWTKRKLIPLLDPSRSDRAQDLWGAYGHSSQCGPDLLAAFKDSLLGILKEVGSVSQRGRDLVYLFIAICLEAPEGTD